MLTFFVDCILSFIYIFHQFHQIPKHQSGVINLFVTLQFLGAVRAVDVISADDEALVGQREAALLAVEAVFVPGVALVVHHVCAMTKACDGVFTSMAFLGHIGLVAVDTVDVVVMRGEASSCQRLTAGGTHETLGVPRLVLVADASRGDSLLAVIALLGKLLVMARSTVDVISFGQEALRANGLLTLEAGEALLVPHLVLVLHILGTWHDHLVAALAAVSVLARAAFAAHDLPVVAGAERLVRQGFVALGTAEAVLVPVAVFVVQLLSIGSNGASTLCAGVGTELVETFGAHMFVVLLHVLLAVQVVPAVVAVEAVRHGGAHVVPGT